MRRRLREPSLKKKRTRKTKNLPSKTMKVEDRLAAKKARIERELGRILSRDDSRLFQAMRYAVLDGGKRFRPLLVLSSGTCFGVALRLLMPFACAIELIHSYSLIHDDLPAMDDDDFRRGKPACHKAFGDGIALLAGDSLLTLAFEVLAEAPVPPEIWRRKEKAVRTIGRHAGSTGMIGGQFLDITLRIGPLTEPRVEEVSLKKTGALIIAAVEVGAILGAARPAEKRAMLSFGRNLGLAFQVRDDLLDSRGRQNGSSSLRPDHVALLGRAGAEKKLAELVSRAEAAVERFSQRAEEMLFLCRSLLNLSPEDKNAQDY
jgi:geranylgeranyl diphosphate synthase type II